MQIRNPGILDQDIHTKVQSFARHEGILTPKHIAYTIFPHGLYRKKGTAEGLFHAYNRKNGLFDRKGTRWGTYFRRMTSYRGVNAIQNQLANIIQAMNDRSLVWKAAYTIVIQEPGTETIRNMGGPCLNFLAVQDCSSSQRELGLLAVYRNHDFLRRAYGNYWGLCNLLRFLAVEVGAVPGPLTCVSSRAYISGKRTAIRTLAEELVPWEGP